MREMKQNEKESGKKLLWVGLILVSVFVLLTVLIQLIDVQAVGQNGTDIGFATFNVWFHNLTGVHMAIYNVTDLLGLIPIFVAIIFFGVGFVQLAKRRSLLKVDKDILFLDIYYMTVIFSIALFEIIPINYRPILIEGHMEASYLSSTTLIVLSVMSTLIFQNNCRLKNIMLKRLLNGLAIGFSVFMVVGRLISGVHWFTDIVGAVILSAGLFFIYKAAVLLFDRK